MQKIDMEWLRERIRKFIGKGRGADLSTNALLFDIARNSEQILTHRMNDIFTGKNKHFADSSESGLVEEAIERLKIADEKVRSAESAKCLAEAELKRYRDEVKSQIDIKLCSIEEQIESAASQLAAAEQRATAAEERARRLEKEMEFQTLANRLSSALHAA